MSELPALNAADLLEYAQHATSLVDVGDDTLATRVSMVIGVLREANLDERGESEAVKVILWLLTNRLRFFEDRKRYPIADEKIVRPVFATGEPRSGTTLLHALLSVDPNGRALRFWELMYPSPPPGLATADDPRRAQADEDWRDIQRRIPKWWISHPYNDMLGNGLPECERTWAFDFRAITPTAWWRVPVKANIGFPSDPSAQYRLHRMTLQHCQYAREPKYWVLKGFHGLRLPALFEAYPDACMIWTHRDPVQIIASRIVLVGQINEAIAGKLDWKAFAKECVELARKSLHAYMNDPMLDDPRIYHVRYADVTRDPIGTIRAFYARYDIPFTVETEAAMRSYLASNRSDRYGKFIYSLDVIGENIEALHEEFAPYRERFGLEIETRR